MLELPRVYADRGSSFHADVVMRLIWHPVSSWTFVLVDPTVKVSIMGMVLLDPTLETVNHNICSVGSVDG